MAKMVVLGGNKWKHALQAVAAAKSAVKVGILEGATYSGEDGQKAGQSVAEVAHWMEFGTSKAPPRPFMRATVDNLGDTWAGQTANLLKRAPKVSKQSVIDALTIMGDVMAKDIMETIESNTHGGPALAASTVERKQALGKANPDLPLVNTGTLQEAINFEVVDNV